MTKKYNYIRQRKDVTSEQTAYTEIVINASPELVKSIFLDFSRKKDPYQAPVNPDVTVNHELSFVWGI